MSSVSVFDSSLEKLKNAIKDINITAKTLVTVTRYAMEIVETTQLKGSAQRDMALQLVRRIVVDAPLSDDVERLCLSMIDSGAIENTIDLVVDASRGKLNINTIVDTGSSCCLAFSSK